MASATFGPVGRNPLVSADEHNYVFLVDNQTTPIVVGHGSFSRVQNGVAGGAAALIKLYDAITGDTLNASNQIATVNLANPTTILFDETAFSRGLIAVMSGATSPPEVLINYRSGGHNPAVGLSGGSTVSPRTFGTQLDGNAGRLSGTSPDKAMAN